MLKMSFGYNHRFIGYQDKTTDGKVLVQKKEGTRCEASFIDLIWLQKGIYILQLQNESILSMKK